eukprot:TRINITY_DN2206_c0_g3_i1.p1 TRINITY_DN2206_c0_g3~~TRINITY_DN2206_c0_g3_i1.p1  ORF type:complete len:147 (-),score=18.83 TRINITY_DN2206_c0_g3_i1:998-1438(-)
MQSAASLFLVAVVDLEHVCMPCAELNHHCRRNQCTTPLNSVMPTLGSKQSEYPPPSCCTMLDGAKAFATAHHQRARSRDETPLQLQDVDRRAFLSSTAAAAVVAATAFVAPAFAEDAAPAKAPLGPMPTDWGLTKDYYTVRTSTTF